MRRAPIVAVATAAGLAGVLAFHTKSAPLTLGIASSADDLEGIPVRSADAGSSPGGTSEANGSSSTARPLPSAPRRRLPIDEHYRPGELIRHRASTSTTTTVPSTTRTATGSSVELQATACLSVSVTATGKKLTNVGIASLDDGGRLSLAVDRPAVDPDPRTGSAAGAEREHPRGVRGELHECGIRAITPVSAQPARVSGYRGNDNVARACVHAIHHREQVMGTVVTIDVECVAPARNARPIRG